MSSPMFNYCKPNYKQSPFNTDYPVDVKSDVAPELRAHNPSTALPPSPVNGGLFRGPQATGPHASIPVPPNSSYYIHVNLKSANPPPGAEYSYISTTRPGNNYSCRPGVFWVNDPNSNYPTNNRYHIQFTKGLNSA